MERPMKCQDMATLGGAEHGLCSSMGVIASFVKKSCNRSYEPLDVGEVEAFKKEVESCPATDAAKRAVDKFLTS